MFNVIFFLLEGGYKYNVGVVLGIVVVDRRNLSVRDVTQKVLQLESEYG